MCGGGGEPPPPLLTLPLGGGGADHLLGGAHSPVGLVDVCGHLEVDTLLLLSGDPLAPDVTGATATGATRVRAVGDAAPLRTQAFVDVEHLIGHGVTVNPVARDAWHLTPAPLGHGAVVVHVNDDHREPRRDTGEGARDAVRAGRRDDDARAVRQNGTARGLERHHDRGREAATVHRIDHTVAHAEAATLAAFIDVGDAPRRRHVGRDAGRHTTGGGASVAALGCGAVVVHVVRATEAAHVIAGDEIVDTSHSVPTLPCGCYCGVLTPPFLCNRLALLVNPCG